VARGSGTQPADVNRLLKQYTQMEKMMGKFARGGMKGLMRQMGGAMKGMGGRGMPGR
jgi:signal recognition particle subunit SRP54